MEIGKASTYALMATVYMAEHAPSRPVQGREIANECGMPFGYLLKILQVLVRREILSSQVGRSGGFKLRRMPHETSVLEIVEAVEGPMIGKVAGRSGCQLSKRASAVLESACKNATKSARAEFERIKLADLVEAGARAGDNHELKVMATA